MGTVSVNLYTIVVLHILDPFGIIRSDTSDCVSICHICLFFLNLYVMHACRKPYLMVEAGCGVLGIKSCRNQPDIFFT